MQGAQRQVATAIIAVAACVSIAACGSSSNTNKSASAGSSGSSTTQTTTTPPAGASGFAAQRSKLEACLKSHGVTLPQRPAGGYGGGYPGGGHPGGGYPGGGYPGGGGTTTTPPTGTGTTGQGFHPGAGGGFFRRLGGSNSKFAKALKACGAQFGAGGFGAGRRFTPHYSKTTLDSFVACVKQHGYSLPAPNTSGTGPIFPRNIETNKQFQAAAKSCESILQGAFRGYPGGAGPGGNPPGTAPPTANGASTTSST